MASTDSGLPASIEAAWGRRERPSKGPRPSLSLERIVAAAVAVADAEGLEAVSMRRIARSLGAGTMSLYRYIATKDDLLALIGDALLGEALVPGELPDDWLEAIAAVARQTRRAYLRHPWAIQLVHRPGAVRASLAGPNGLRHAEQSLSALSGAPMDDRTKLEVLAIVEDYGLGHLIRASANTTEAAAAPVPTPDATRVADFIRSQLASGDFPQLAAVTSAADVVEFTDQADLDAQFELGLRLLLDGIASRFR